jgi:hypothetical protein
MFVFQGYFVIPSRGSVGDCGAVMLASVDAARLEVAGGVAREREW